MSGAVNLAESRIAKLQKLKASQGRDKIISAIAFAGFGLVGWFIGARPPEMHPIYIPMGFFALSLLIAVAREENTDAALILAQMELDRVWQAPEPVAPPEYDGPKLWELNKS